MGKKYNEFTTSDMPIEDVDISTNQPLKTTSSTAQKSANKPKITRVGGTKSGTSKSATGVKSSKSTSNSATSASKTNSLKKNSVSTKELEKLNEESLKNYSFRNRRNRVIIIILTILLILSIVGIVVYVYNSTKKPNCFVNIDGANAYCKVDNNKLKEFRVPANLMGNRAYKINTDLVIEDGGDYIVTFEVICYQNGEQINNIALDYNNQLFEQRANRNKYVSKTSLSGGNSYDLFECVYLSRDYEFSLNSNNFKMDINISLEKV